MIADSFCDDWMKFLKVKKIYIVFSPQLSSEQYIIDPS